MQTKVTWIGLSVLGLAALLASCSGDDGDSDNGSGGSSNTSGNGSGGSSSAGKAGSTSAGNTNAGSGSGGKVGGTGGNSSAGTAGFSFGGNLNLGGGGFDPDDFACNPAPTPGTDCQSDSQPCLNGTEVCYCAMAEWTCVDIMAGAGGAGPDIGDLECPPSKPASGSACDAPGVCPYGGQNEGCACYGGMWACTP